MGPTLHGVHRPSAGLSPTAARILQAAVDVLNEDGFDRFQIQNVIDRSGMSRTTIYNHFADVDALVEAALVAAFDVEVTGNREAIAQMIDELPDMDAFRLALRAFVDQLSRTPAAVRRRRIHTLALASTRPDLAVGILDAQDRVTQGDEAVIRRGQERGFIRPELDPRSVAVLVQSTTLGRIVDDATSGPLDDERWAAMYFDLLDKYLLVAE